MFKFSLKRKILFRCAVFGIITFLFAISCEKPTEPEDNLPEIKNIIFRDPPYYISQIIDISAEVQDEDITSVEYFWKVSAGSLYATINEFIQLKLPDEPKRVTIYLEVKDAAGQSTRRTKTINMDNGATLEGYCFYFKTKIPIKDVMVKLENLETKTDKNGYYKIANCIEGKNLRLVADKNEFSVFDTTFEIKNGSKNNIDFSLSSLTQTYQVSGYIRTGDNESISNVKVQLYNPDNTPSNIFTTSNSYGLYSLDNVPSGKHILKTSESIDDIIVENDFPVIVLDHNIQYDIRAYKYKVVIEEQNPQPDSTGYLWYHHDFPFKCKKVNIYYETQRSGDLRCTFYINGYYSNYWYYHDPVTVYNLTNVETKLALLGNSVDMQISGYLNVIIFRLSYYY
jgi:hypothetical protein